nr:hypothetical protein [Tanacetum cinerariifolium]
MFGHSLGTCPMRSSETPTAAPMDDLNDGFTKVVRKRNKGNKADQQPKSKNTGGSQSNKPKPRSYRPTMGYCSTLPETTGTQEPNHGGGNGSKDPLDRMPNGAKNMSRTGGGKKDLVFSPKSKIHYFDSDGTVFDDLDQVVETSDYGNGSSYGSMSLPVS